MMWNKAYVLAHHPGAFANQISPWGNKTKGWHVYIENVGDVTGRRTWHFSGKSATDAWKAAAEAVEAQQRHKASNHVADRTEGNHG